MSLLVVKEKSTTMAAIFKIKMFNFVESEINFYSFIRFPSFLFRIMFFKFQPLSDPATRKEKIEYCARMIFMKFSLFCSIMTAFQILIYAVVNSDDFEALYRGIPDVLSTIIILSKAVATVEHKDAIWNICEKLNDVFGTRGNENVGLSSKKYLDGYHRIIKVYAGIFTMMLVQVSSPWVLYLMTGVMKTPSNYWFPFDIFTPEVFPFILVWSNWNSFLFIIFFLASDSIFYALVTVIAMEFDHLRTEFKALKIASKGDRNDKFVVLITRHEKLMEIADNLQEVYAVTFLIIFLVSSLLMCFVAFRLSTAELNLETFMFYLTYMGIIGGQTMLLCFYGQRLIDSSSGVADGIYEGDWIESDNNEFKKLMVLVILRSRRPKQFSAMKFAIVSVERFTTVNIFYLHRLVTKICCFTDFIDNLFLL